MLRVRIDGGALTLAQLRVHRRHLATTSPATPPTSPTGRTSSCTGSASRTCPRSGSASRPSACRPPRPAATPRASSSARPSPASPPTRSSTAPRRSTRSPAASSATPSSPTCRASSRRRSPGTRSQDVAHEINDISFVGVVHPELGPGFDLWVGGGLSTNPMLGRAARRLRRRSSEVPDVWLGVISIFRDYGYRRLRTKARLKFLSPTGARRSSARCSRPSTSAAPLPDGPPPAPPTGPRRPRRRAPAEGRPPLRRRRPDRRPRQRRRLTGLADLAEAAGSDRVRLTAAAEAARARRRRRRASTPRRRPATRSASTVRPEPVPPRHDGLHRHRVLQARHRRDQGHRGHARRRARAPARRRHDQLDTPVTINVNGCPNSCARIQVADIGLKGMIVTDDDGEQVEGFQVHLGGGLASRPRRGRPRPHRRGLKVTAADLPDYVERVVRRFARPARGRRDVRHLGPPRRRGGAAAMTAPTSLPAPTPAPAPAAAPTSCARSPSRAPASSAGRHGRRGRRLGGAHLPRHASPSRASMAGRRAAAPGRREPRPGRRRALPRHRLPLRRDPRHPRRRRARCST